MIGRHEIKPVPVLVSGESGLGAMLREALESEQASRLVVPMSGDDNQDSEEWGRAVEAMLRDRGQRSAERPKYVPTSASRRRG